MLIFRLTPLTFLTLLWKVVWAKKVRAVRENVNALVALRSVIPCHPMQNIPETVAAFVYRIDQP
jgi:hypothetical protein